MLCKWKCLEPDCIKNNQYSSYVIRGQSKSWVKHSLLKRYIKRHKLKHHHPGLICVLIINENLKFKIEII